MTTIGIVAMQVRGRHVRSRILSINSVNINQSSSYMPENGWSNGVALVSESAKVFKSNVPERTYRQITKQSGFDAYTAERLDSIGVTADQFFEAWNLLGSSSFSMGRELIETQAGVNSLDSELKSKVATHDLRYAYALIASTIAADTADVVPVAKRMGYERFFTLAGSGMSLEQIAYVEVNDIDPMLIDSLNGIE